MYLYKKGYNPALPTVCMDEKSKQLLEDNRKPIAAKPGSYEKYGYEYKRRGLVTYSWQLNQKQESVL